MLELTRRLTRSNPLDQALKRNARSFYLTLQMLPRSLKTPVSLAYLLARAVDTITDDADLALSRDDRQQLLMALEERLERRLAGQDESVFSGFHQNVSERLDGVPPLFLALDDAEDAFLSLDDLQQTRICEVVLDLLGAMFFDLEHFRPGELRAVGPFTDAEDYTYMAAGCVGRFWHSLSRNHLNDHAPADSELRAVDYGRALQWTNILKDLPKDLRNGRCYIPESALRTVGLTPADLLNPESFVQFAPLYRRFLSHAYAHFLNGWRFVEALSFGEYRLRLASSWPALFGMQTLSLLADSTCNPLDPEQRLKIDRGDIYQTLLSTSTQYWIPGRGSWLFRQHLRDLEEKGIEAKSFVFAAT